MKVKSPYKLITSLAIPQLAGLIGSAFTSPAIPTWYASIIKPEFSPPNWIFAPVWISLYFLMGISLYIVWDKGFQRKDVRTGMSVFCVQLALNAIWSVLFFGLRSPFLAFVNIVFLWIMIALSIYLFHRISRTAGLLLVPYILWVSFAAILNYAIWIIN